MISEQLEIEKIINNKFMKKIQDSTTVYELNKPETYDSIDINDLKTDIKVSEKSYKYLDDEPLHKVIETNVNTEFHYVLYNIVDDTVSPFIKFLMCNNENIMKFPNNKPNNENIDESISGEDSVSETDEIILYEDSDDSSDIEFKDGGSGYDDDVYILNECSQYLEEKFGIDYELSENNYKGYVNVNDNIYIFIDVSQIDIKFLDNHIFSWVIIDEITNKHVSNNIPICDKIIEMFSTNHVIKNIYNENNEPIEIPICVYICEKEDSGYMNVELKSSVNTSLITKKVNHDIFGSTTMFSSLHIKNDEKDHERYCLFTKDSVYVLHSNFTKSDISMIHDRACIRFPYNDIECWSVRDLSLYSSI